MMLLIQREILKKYLYLSFQLSIISSDNKTTSQGGVVLSGIVHAIFSPFSHRCLILDNEVSYNLFHVDFRNCKDII